MTGSDKSYLAYMAARLLELHRVLKPTGSLYLHCDPTMSHYLKILIDAIFGRRNLRNEIVWHYRRWTGKAKRLQRLHDVVLFYTKTNDYKFNVPYDPYTERSLERKQHYHTRIKDGDAYVTSIDARGVRAGDVWNIPVLNSQAKERVGYPTQKPLALLARIVTASSDPGDVVLDPFSGCSTACIAAEQQQRRWVGIDISPKAADLVRQRMRDELGMFYDGAHRTDVPQRTDLGKLPRYNSTGNRTRLYGEQSGNCAGCTDHFEARHLEVDHIIARGKGGTDHTDNLQLLCGNCNRIKATAGWTTYESSYRSDEISFNQTETLPLPPPVRARLRLRRDLLCCQRPVTLTRRRDSGFASLARREAGSRSARLP